MNIVISDKDKVTDAQCISCYECTSEASCPVPDTVNLELKMKTSKVESEVKSYEN